MLAVHHVRYQPRSLQTPALASLRQTRLRSVSTLAVTDSSSIGKASEVQETVLRKSAT